MEGNRYPDNYFEHYIVCFSTTGCTLDKKGFEKIARLYIEIEGINGFIQLIKEIQVVKDNNDWAYFESIAGDFGIEGFNTINLKVMAEVATNVYHNISAAGNN